MEGEKPRKELINHVLCDIMGEKGGVFLKRQKRILTALCAVGGCAALLAGCGGEPAANPVSSATSTAVSQVQTSSVVSQAPQPSSASSAVRPTSSVVSSQPVVSKSSEAEVKAKCKTLDYKSLLRSPDKYEGEYASFYGRVLQVSEEATIDGTLVGIRLGTSSSNPYYPYGDDVVYVFYFLPTGADRILEDDYITVYGEMTELYTYTTVRGDGVTIPCLAAYYADLA